MVLASTTHTVEAGLQPVPPGTALLVPLFDRAFDGSQRLATIAEALLSPLTARFAARVAPVCDFQAAASRVGEWVNQSSRLLLLPFGRGAGTQMLVAQEGLQRTLAARTGEQVNSEALPLPVGRVGAPIFAPLEGVACAATQLTPLMRLFPGWSGQYLGLSSGTVRLVLFEQSASGGEQPAGDEAALAIMALLESACVLRASPWQRDGALFASYLQSLVSAVLRGPFLRCAEGARTA